MKKYIETLGNFIQDQAIKSPDRARKLLELVYSYVRFSGMHHLKKTSRNTYDYMIGTVAGTITDSFKNPKESVIVNVFFPCEILHAMDLKPMLPEGISAYLACTGCQNIFAETAESNDVPETFCSYHKTMIGMAEAGVMPSPLTIANTTLCCDANQLSFRRLAEHYNISRTVIDVPHDDTEDSVKYVADQLRDFVKLLEKETGRKFDEDKFRDILLRSQRTIEMYKNFLDKRAEKTIPSNMSGEMCNLIANHMLLGTEESEIYVEKLQQMVDMAEKRSNTDKKRIFWVHTLPNWQESMTDIFEKDFNAEIVGSDISVDALFDINLDKPFESLAKRLVGSSFNGFSENRINSILENAKKLNSDGIIIFCHWGCKQTLGMSQMAKEIFEANGLPTLILDGDGCDSRNVADGQMVTRVNAFIEQLEGLDLNA